VDVTGLVSCRMSILKRQVLLSHCLSSSSEFTRCLYNELYIQLMAQYDQVWYVTALRSASYIYTTLEAGLSADSGAPLPPSERLHRMTLCLIGLMPVSDTDPASLLIIPAQIPSAV
jgi:hypothetical protein